MSKTSTWRSRFPTAERWAEYEGDYAYTAGARRVQLSTNSNFCDDVPRYCGTAGALQIQSFSSFVSAVFQRTGDQIMQIHNRYVLFADIKGFSKIADGELPAIMGSVWTKIASILKPHKDAIVAYNTWGDALFLVFTSASVVAAVLEIRGWFRSHDQLAIRIACHFGDFYEYDDPILQRKNALGANINLAARIEPITRPNSIFVTGAFKAAFTQAKDPGKPSQLEFDELGEIELAKKFGEAELFLLRRFDEGKHILDRLAQIDLSWALPDFDEINAEQIGRIKELKPLAGDLLRHIPRPDLSDTNAAFGKSLAKLHQQAGNYDIANQIMETLMGITLEADGLTVVPLEQERDFVKLRANNATRRGDFGLAHRLLYGLCKSGAQDTDTLTMLASCYKRRAFYDKDGSRYEEPKRPLLKRSRDLYLEAVRKDVGDYYPVINAAYAHAFLKETGVANKLANYCSDLLGETHDENWWAASTYAETEVVLSDYEEAGRKLKGAIEVHQPDSFEKDALVDQLKLLAIVRKEPGLTELISSLD